MYRNMVFLNTKNINFLDKIFKFSKTILMNVLIASLYGPWKQKDEGNFFLNSFFLIICFVFYFL